MRKNRIRLTESQLHRVINESVNKILKEVKIGGESFHGNNPTDWAAIGDLRHNLYYDENNDEWNDWNDSQVERDYENAEKIGGSRRDSKGMNKAIRAKTRIGESQLHRVIKESVKRVLSEMSSDGADKNINDMIPNLDGERFQNMSKDRQNKLSWNCIDNAYDEHLNDLLSGEPYNNNNPFTWNNGPAAIGDEPIGFRQAMRPEYWRNRGVDGKFENGYINGGIGEYDPQKDGDFAALSHDDKFGYTNLNEGIRRVVRRVLNEEKNAMTRRR